MTKDDKLPLGISEKAWKDMSDEDRDKLTGISEFNLDFIVGDPMFRQGVTNKRFHFDVQDELKKFLAIKVIAEPHPLGMFSPLVATAWHCFILNTIQYEEFCQKYYGRTIHHVPGGGAGSDNSVWIAIYREWFGEFPMIWMLDIGGTEIPKYAYSLNTEGALTSRDLDSDDGQYAQPER